MIIYKAEFCNRHGIKYEIFLEPQNTIESIDVTIPLDLANDPLVITSESGNDIFPSYCYKRATIKILTSQQLDQFFTTDPLGVKVTVKISDFGEIFEGYLTPNVYSQPYDYIDEIELEAVDFLGVLQFIDYQRVPDYRINPADLSFNEKPTEVSIYQHFNRRNSLANIIINCFKLSKLRDNFFFTPCLYHTQIGTKKNIWPNGLKVQDLSEIDNNNITKTDISVFELIQNNKTNYTVLDILDLWIIDEDNFFSDDDERTPMKCLEVLSEIAKVLGCCFYQNYLENPYYMESGKTYNLVQHKFGVKQLRFLPDYYDFQSIDGFTITVPPKYGLFLPDNLVYNSGLSESMPIDTKDLFDTVPQLDFSNSFDKISINVNQYPVKKLKLSEILFKDFKTHGTKDFTNRITRASGNYHYGDYYKTLYFFGSSSNSNYETYNWTFNLDLTQGIAGKEPVFNHKTNNNNQFYVTYDINGNPIYSNLPESSSVPQLMKNPLVLIDDRVFTNDWTGSVVAKVLDKKIYEYETDKYFLGTGEDTDNVIKFQMGIKSNTSTQITSTRQLFTYSFWDGLHIPVMSINLGKYFSHNNQFDYLIFSGELAYTGWINDALGNFNYYLSENGPDYDYWGDNTDGFIFQPYRIVPIRIKIGDKFLFVNYKGMHENSFKSFYCSDFDIFWGTIEEINSRFGSLNWTAWKGVSCWLPIEFDNPNTSSDNRQVFEWRNIFNIFNRVINNNDGITDEGFVIPLFNYSTNDDFDNYTPDYEGGRVKSNLSLSGDIEITVFRPNLPCYNMQTYEAQFKHAYLKDFEIKQVSVPSDFNRYDFSEEKENQDIIFSNKERGQEFFNEFDEIELKIHTQQANLPMSLGSIIMTSTNYTYQGNNDEWLEKVYSPIFKQNLMIEEVLLKMYEKLLSKPTKSISYCYDVTSRLEPEPRHIQNLAKLTNNVVFDGFIIRSTEFHVSDSYSNISLAQCPSLYDNLIEL